MAARKIRYWRVAFNVVSTASAKGRRMRMQADEVFIAVDKKVLRDRVNEKGVKMAGWDMDFCELFSVREISREEYEKRSQEVMQPIEKEAAGTAPPSNPEPKTDEASKTEESKDRGQRSASKRKTKPAKEVA